MFMKTGEKVSVFENLFVFFYVMSTREDTGDTQRTKFIIVTGPRAKRPWVPVTWRHTGKHCQEAEGRSGGTDQAATFA